MDNLNYYTNYVIFIFNQFLFCIFTNNIPRYFNLSSTTRISYSSKKKIKTFYQKRKYIGFAQGKNIGWEIGRPR